MPSPPAESPSVAELDESLFLRLFGPSDHAPEPGEIHAGLLPTPLGPMVAAAAPEGICLLEFSDPHRLPLQVRTLSRRLKRPIAPGDSPHLQTLRLELEAYFAGSLQDFATPLFAPGTPFQEAVWRELARVPFGSTLSYQALATRIGKPAAVRAVGHANGMNPVSILIPCHRVVNKNGNLCGYGGGLWRKQALLELERSGRLPAFTPPVGPDPLLAGILASI